MTSVSKLKLRCCSLVAKSRLIKGSCILLCPFLVNFSFSYSVF